MCLPGLKHRLLPNNTFAFYFTSGKAGIENVPVPPHQLNGVLALIFDCNAIGKNIMVLTGTGICGLVFRLYTNLDPLRDFSDHTSQKYQFFTFSLSILRVEF
jgi:hypothetical protein